LTYITIGGNLYYEDSSFVDFAFKRDLSIVSFHYPFAHDQAEALTLTLRREEGRKELHACML
jgi:hypothetical protein